MELDLYGEIGGFYGVTAKQFRETLKGISARQIVLNINSPGGDVFDGIAIYNNLLDYGGDVVVRVQGLAASAASIVAMAGDTIEIAENAFFMIHNAWTIALGDRRVMEDRAKLLAKIDGELAATYSRRTGEDEETIAADMNAETWLTATEAIDRGFADTLIETAAAEANAAFDLTNFKNVPRALKQPRRVANKTKPEPVAPVVDYSSILSAMSGLRFV